MALYLACALLPTNFSVLHFREHQMLEERMMGCKARDTEAGEAVSKAGFKNVAAQESEGRCGRNFQSGRTPTGLEHLAGSKWGIALANHSVVMSCIADAIVQDVAG